MDREQQEREAGLAFSDLLRERVAANSLTPQLRAYLEPEGDEAQPQTNEPGEGEQE
jgi:hypothetical protein